MDVAVDEARYDPPPTAIDDLGIRRRCANVRFRGSKQILAVNPAGAAPSLREDDGWLLTQAGAILEYLVHKHPEAGLTGGDGVRAQAEAHRWSAFFTSDVHTALWPIFMPYRYTTDGSEAARQAVVEAGHRLVAKQFGILDRHLNGRNSILDGGRSVIDAYSFPMIRWAIKLLSGGLKEYPNVQALQDRIAADPVVQNVLAREAGG